MDNSSCAVCHSDSDSLFVFAGYSHALGRGLDIGIEDLLKAATTGCQLCSLFLNTLRVFQGLSPDFEANYHDNKVDRLFVHPSTAGSIDIALKSSGTYVDHLELYTQDDSELLWPEIGYGKDVTETLSLGIASKKIEGWMAACEQHSSCTVTPSEFTVLPTRALLISKYKISLVETAGRHGRYATLSHCWGTSQPLTTTRDTLNQRYAGIRWSSLPRLFQDAIALTRVLGMQYLWIDSLCIIQGDDEDWTRESAQMASIYHRSYLNIAATSAAGSVQSLFSDRWTTPVRYLHESDNPPKRPVRSYTVALTSGSATIKTRYSTRAAHEHVKMFHHSREGAQSTVLQQGPLLTRSWAFQERILSPRTVHFHASEMLWECNEELRCECNGLDVEDAGMFSGNLVVGKRWMYETVTELNDPGEYGYSLLDRWLDGVELYSRLGITKGADRLPALAGLATSFANRIQSPYLAGVWHRDLPRSLCWLVTGEEKYSPQTAMYSKLGKPSISYSAPSWSWASIHPSGAGTETPLGPNIAFGHLITKDFCADERFSLLDVNCSVDPVSPFGRVADGNLKIRAAALERPLYFDSKNLGVFFSFDEDYQPVFLDFDEDYFTPHNSNYSFEDVKDLRELDVLLVSIGTVDGEMGGRRTIMALILRPVMNRAGMFERIGILKCLDGGWFSNARVHTIEIV